MVKQKKHSSGLKVATIVLVSIILIVVVVSIVNVGLGIFLERPDYSDHCGGVKAIGVVEDQQQCEDLGGRWTQQEIRCVTEPCPQGYCDTDFECREEYDKVMEEYNQIRFYVFASLGLVLLLVGLFMNEIVFRSVGLASGGILIFEGVVMNLDNRLAVFSLLVVILVVAGWFGWKAVKKLK